MNGPEPLSTKVTLMKVTPSPLGATGAAKVATFPLTARQLIDMAWKWVPNALAVKEPVGFSPEGPLVIATLNCGPLPVTES